MTNIKAQLLRNLMNLTAQQEECLKNNRQFSMLMYAAVLFFVLK